MPPEDSEALAHGIEQVLTRRDSYDPARLRAYAVAKYGFEAVSRQLAELYAEAIRATPASV